MRLECNDASTSATNQKNQWNDVTATLEWHSKNMQEFSH